METHKTAFIYKKNIKIGILKELKKNQLYTFTYNDDYSGASISLTMPIEKKHFEYTQLPPFFEGLLPEGMQLEALLKKRKLDRDDLFEQLLSIGEDVVGDVTIKRNSI